MRRDVMNAGLDFLQSRFRATIDAKSREAIWEDLSGMNDEDFRDACAKIREEEDQLPRNLARAIKARRSPRVTVEQYVPREMSHYSGSDLNKNLARIKMLRSIMANKDNPRRKKILDCAEASLREGDTLQALAKWGKWIEDEITAEIEERIGKPAVEEFEQGEEWQEVIP